MCTFFTISVFNSYAQKVDQRFAIQDSRIGELNQFNDTYRQQIYNSFLTLSRLLNITQEDSLREINSLKESDLKLMSAVDNLTSYINSLNLTCTNSTTTIIYNITNNATTQIPIQTSCRQYLINKYSLGDYFDVVACCELRQVGYANECCSCYK